MSLGERLAWMLPLVAFLGVGVSLLLGSRNVTPPSAALSVRIGAAGQLALAAAIGIIIVTGNRRSGLLPCLAWPSLMLLRPLLVQVVRRREQRQQA